MLDGAGSLLERADDDQALGDDVIPLQEVNGLLYLSGGQALAEIL